MKHMKWVAYLFLYFFALNAIAGKGLTCFDHRNIPVNEIPDLSIQDIAMATYANGYPVIVYNPNVTMSISRQTEAFFFAHECAHHVLAHAMRNIPFSSEQEADCWAVNALYNNGIFSNQDVRVVQNELSMLGRGDWTHLPGPQRAINLEACLSSSSSGGDDTESKWEKCTEDCDGKWSRCFDRCSSDSCYSRCDSQETRCKNKCDSKYGY